jgi:hypothetical protein
VNPAGDELVLHEWRGVLTRSIGLLLSGLLTHCGLTGPSQLQTRLESIVGKPIDEAVGIWGVPDATFELADGAAYTWKRPWTASGVNYAVQGGQAYAVQTVCVITKWVYENC